MSNSILIPPRLELVEQIFQIPDLEMLDLSPDGRTILVLSNHSGSYQLYSLPVNGGDLHQVSHGNERVSYARISRDSQSVIFSRDQGGREQHQLYRASLERDEEEQQLTHLDGNRIAEFDWSNHNGRIAFAGSTQDYNGLWIVDVNTGKTSEIYHQKHWLFGPQWSHDDRTIIVSAKTTGHPTAMELLFKDVDSDASIIYTPKPGSENVRPQWNPRDSSLVLFKTDANNRYDLAVYNKDRFQLSYLKAGSDMLGLDFPIFGWMPDGRSIYYLGTREGRTRLYIEYYNSDASPREVPLPPGYHAGFLNESLKANGTNIVYSYSSLSRPPAVASTDVRTRQITRIHESKTELPLGTAEHVVYQSFDGRPIHGWFIKPVGQTGPRPAVLWVHGGPAWEVADTWNEAIQSFLVAGYPVFAPNIRGSTGYGSEFERLNIHDIGGADLRDVEEAAKYMQGRGEVDRKKIALVGASYGGYMTFLGMTKKPEYWAAGAAIVGITDWLEMYSLSDAIFKSFIERYFGKPEENMELYRDRSPINFVENVKAPLLIWHRGNDSRCPVGPVEKFARRMEELGKKCEMTVVWDEGHGFQKTENLTRQYKGIISFLDRELGPPGKVN